MICNDSVIVISGKWVRLISSALSEMSKIEMFNRIMFDLNLHLVYHS